MSRLRRWGMRALFGLVVFVILVLAARLWLGSIAQERLDAELALIRTAGDPVTLSEAAPSPVAPSENAAVLLQQAFELAHEEDDDNLWYAEEAYHEDPFGVAEEAAAVMAAWVAANARPLELATQALGRPHCIFPRDWSSSETLKLDQIPGLQLLSRLWMTQAYLAARRGELDQAIGTCGSILRLAELSSEHPLLVDLLVSMGIGWVGTRTAEVILRRGSPTKGALEGLLATITEQTPEADLRPCLVLERAYINSALFALAENPAGLGQLSAPYLWGRPLTIKQQVLAWLVPRAVVRLDHARFLARFRQALDLAAHPYRASRSAWASFLTGEENQPWYALVSTDELSLQPLSALRTAQYGVRLDLMRLALHAELYRLEHGVPPGTLDDLDAADMPRDRFRDAPYSYRRLDDGGFLIYSVGPNALDDDGVDGGDEIETQGDIVWRR